MPQIHAFQFIKNIYVRKWLPKEEKDNDYTLRKKSKQVNYFRNATANGKKPFIIINGHVKERAIDGRFNLKKPLDVDAYLKISHSV